MNGFGGISEDAASINELKGVFSEAIDLVIGTRETELFKKKHDCYMAGKYYTIQNFYDELEFILNKAADDKSSKRMDRRDFLESLLSSPYAPEYDRILRIIGGMIHS